MNNMNFSRHGKIEQDENGMDIIELLSSDDEIEQPQPTAHPPQQQQNYNQSVNSSAQNEFQFKTEIVHDSLNLSSMNPYLSTAYQEDDTYHNDDGDVGGGADNGAIIEDHFSEPYLSEESSDEEFIKNLKTKHHYGQQTVQSSSVQTGPKYLMDTARSSAPSPTTAPSPAMVTSTTAMTPAHTSSPSPLLNPNYSTESQSNFENSTNQNQAIHAEINQNITSNLAFDDLFKNTDAKQAQAMAQLIDTKVKQHMKETLNELMKQYDLVPKGSKKEDDQKPKQQKRKSEKNANATDKRHGHEYRPMKKERLVRSSSESSLEDLFGPSTSTPRYSGKAK